jgi:hypothetical protein
MASQNSSAAPAIPAPAEHCVEPVLPSPLSPPLLRQRQPTDPSCSQVVQDLSTIEEIIKYIVNTRQHLSALDGESILAFH